MGQLFRRYLLLFAKGMAMGAGDVVPGVSGGTIAFITGIYEELIDSLRRIDQRAFTVLFSQGIGPAWHYINGSFLLTLFSGVLFSIATLAGVISYCLETYPILIWAFFFGLVCASVVYIGRQIPRWRLREITLFSVGALLALLITLARPAQLPSDWWMIMLAGSIAICAMILPGVSGAFLLLLMGLYPTILRAVTEFDWFLLGCFGIGCIVGLLLFSHLLSWLLHRYHSITLAALTGILLGSLNALWPWKHTVESYINRHGESVPLVQENITPVAYSTLFNQDSQWLLAFLAAFIGVLLVLGLEMIGSKKSLNGKV